MKKANECRALLTIYHKTGTELLVVTVFTSSNPLKLCRVTPLLLWQVICASKKSRYRCQTTLLFKLTENEMQYPLRLQLYCLDPWMCPIFFNLLFLSTSAFHVYHRPLLSSVLLVFCIRVHFHFLKESFLSHPPSYPQCQLAALLHAFHFPITASVIVWKLCTGCSPLATISMNPEPTPYFLTSFSASIRGTGSQQNSIKGFVLTETQCSEFRAKVRDRL